MAAMSSNYYHQSPYEALARAFNSEEYRAEQQAQADELRALQENRAAWLARTNALAAMPEDERAAVLQAEWEAAEAARQATEARQRAVQQRAWAQDPGRRGRWQTYALEHPLYRNHRGALLQYDPEQPPEWFEWENCPR
jgi:hypothetical protein